MSSTFLGIWRAFAVGFFSLVALAEISVTIPFVARSERLHARTAWLQRWSRFACRVLAIRLTRRGWMPQAGVLVCSHVRFVDIVLLIPLRPDVWVGRAEVSAWPLAVG